MEKREFAVRFIIDDKNNIQTHINSLAVSPTEAIGLLEMAKDQLMENLRSGRKNIFDVQGKL